MPIRFFQANLSIMLTVLLVNSSLAALGPAPPGTAIAEYNWKTGEITVSVDGVNNWYVESSSERLGREGDVQGLPGAGGLVSDNDTRIGESNFINFSYADLNLGPVASSGLAFNHDDSIPDLSIWWNVGLGVPMMQQPVYLAPGSVYGEPINAPPIAGINGPFEFNLLKHDLYHEATRHYSLSTYLSAKSSIDDGNGPTKLTYMWDLDNDGTFEVNRGYVSLLRIDDVSETFTGLGTFPVSVKVSDGLYSDVASTTIEINEDPLEPEKAWAEYNPETGEIIVSADGVNGWQVRSFSKSLTEDSVSGLPTSDNGMSFDHDWYIGEFGRTGTARSLLTFNDLNLGKVAETGLPEGDLIISWYVLGESEEARPVTYMGSDAQQLDALPEPTSLALFVLGLVPMAVLRQRCNVALL